jgi:cbb3-type cytochrome oxidase subunit 3
MKRYRVHLILVVSFLFLINLLKAQITDGKVSEINFNEGNLLDNSRGRSIKGSGYSFTNDRFGNPAASAYLHGTIDSYLNLGTDSIIKPKSGSISLWFKLDREILSGKGYSLNPIVLTKCAQRDDFFEAYCIYYDYVNQRVASGSTLDSTMQVNTHAPDKVELNQWNHVVVTFNDDFLALYLNGEQACKLKKGFTTAYLSNDSVVVGNSANTKNSRYFNGCIDDIIVYNKVLSPFDVSQLYKQPNPNQQKEAIDLMLIIAAFIILLIGIVLIIYWRVKKVINRERQRSLLLQQVNDAELKARRSQMNPHFIFNALSSIQQFVLAKDTDNAYSYLSKFSKLVRLLLESSAEGNITLNKEIDILKRYIELESLRFDSSFEFHLEVDKIIVTESLSIPQMMIQPFVENAIWHGLLPKKGTKNLWIRIKPYNENILSIEIEDDGVGRTEKRVELVMQHKKRSMALEVTKQRLQLLNEQLKLNLELKIIDKEEGGVKKGTRVKILIPIFKH